MRTVNLLFLTVLLLAGTALAHTSMVVERQCPLCNTTFKAEIDASGTQFGRRLDLKPTGAIAAPGRIPVCTNCSFVVFTDKLSVAEKKSLNAFVNGTPYKAHATNESSYFLLGTILEHLKKDELTLARVYLKASWQVEETPEKYEAYLVRSLKHLSSFFDNNATQDESWRTAQLLYGEILRQLSRFDEARAHFQSLTNVAEFAQQPYRGIREYEISLIKEKNSNPQEVPAIEWTETDIRQTMPFKMLEANSALRPWTNLFEVSDMDAGAKHTFGVYFNNHGEWSGDFVPREKLSCDSMAELVFPLTKSNTVTVGLAPEGVLAALKEVCTTQFILEMNTGGTNVRVRLRAAGDRLHWDTLEVDSYARALRSHGINTPPIREWMTIILDTSDAGMISMFHPKGTDLFVVDSWLLSHEKWRQAYRRLVPNSVPDETGTFDDAKYCAVVNGKGDLKLLETPDRRKAVWTRLSINGLGIAAHSYRLQKGRWPGSLGELMGNEQPAEKAVRDEWGNAFVYRPFDGKLGYGEIMSLGSDGKENGKDLAEDIILRFNDEEYTIEAK